MNAGEASAERRVILQTVARRVMPATAGGCVLVAGVDGAGKSTFGDALAALLRAEARPVLRASADDFHHPRAVRYRRGRDSPSGFWLHSFDYDSLRRNLLEPLRPGGSRRHRSASHELTTDAVLDLPWQTPPSGTVLILDGLFLHRDELAGLWEFSVFVDVPFAVSVARMAARDGTNPDPKHPSVARYVRGQSLYFDACSPWDRADLVIDNTDWNHPMVALAGEGPSARRAEKLSRWRSGERRPAMHRSSPDLLGELGYVTTPELVSERLAALEDATSSCWPTRGPA